MAQIDLHTQFSHWLCQLRFFYVGHTSRKAKQPLKGTELQEMMKKDEK